MADRRTRTRAPRCVEALEPRSAPAALGLGASALALYGSPLAAAARSAALAYQAGQLAYTGRTSFLLGTVRVTQPYALRDLRGGHRHPAGHGPGPALPHVQFHRPFGKD